MKVFVSRISLFAVLLFLFSCGSTKDMILLQHNPPIGSTQEQAKSIPVQDKEYRLRSNDRLMLNIFSLTDEKINFLKEPLVERVVDAKGQIEMPVIGAITVAGLTIKQAEDTIKHTAADYLRSPSVTIKVMNFQVTVLGEVTKQGAILVPESKINLLEALGQAGGLTENANRHDIRIVRNDQKSAKIYQINLLDEKTLSSKNFYLEPNDVVLVNPKRSVSTRQNQFATIGLVVSLASSATFLLLQVFR